MKRLSSTLALLAAGLFGAQVLAAQVAAWPHEAPAGNGKAVIYLPQIDSLRGDQLYARAAISVTQDSSGEPVFGAIWFGAHLLTDRDAGIVQVFDVKVLRVRFPDTSPDLDQKLTSLVEKQANTWDLSMPLKALETGLAAAERERANAAGIKAEPPRIEVATVPTVLILIDGQPILRPVENTDYQQVINTAYAIVFDPKAKTYWLIGNNYWYSAPAATGPYQNVPQPPADIVKLLPPDTTAAADSAGPAPAIVVATQPTELIVTDGKPAFAPITGTDLLYVTNSQNQLFKYIGNQDYYVLLSGRWFAARSTDGPWRGVLPDSLPADFRKIPAESPAAAVLPSVPGTTEAEDALANAAIPQTAAVKRADAKLEVSYDGEPRFDSIPGTSIKYAINTATPVILTEGKYYACSDAVWYVSGSAKGPWIVSDSVPQEVQKIPASSPVYNVKYVTVYQSTPEVVYVGYTPGYVGMYPYYGTVVYGTGWYYPPYIGPVFFYPRPPTYGFHARYNPWTGWTFGMTYSTGFMTVGVVWVGFYRPPMFGGWHGGGWYGPGGFRPPPGRRPPHWGHPVHRMPPPGYRPPAGYRPPPTTLPANNMYNRPENKAAVTQPKPSTRDVKTGPAAGTKDNVFVDNSGNVYRKTDQGWDSRQGNSWKPDNQAGYKASTQPAQPSKPPTQPTQPQQRPAQPSQPQQKPAQPSQPSQPQQRPAQPTQPQQRPSTQPQQRPTQQPSSGGQQQLNRDAQARQRATSQPARPSGGGGGSGGGARRR